MLDLTLISCNYNTPDLISTMLKSWRCHNADATNKCIIIDNSSDNESLPFFQENNIPHVVNRKELHHRGVQVAMDMVKTRYALLVDSDVVFNKNVTPELSRFVNENIHLAGHVEGDRGGHLVFRRVHPWFCFIDMDFVNFHGLRYTDQNRIRATNSEMFFSHIPDCKLYPHRRYDVGSTFLEDVMKVNGRVLNINHSPHFFTHYEGMSWHKFSDMVDDTHWMGREAEYQRDFDLYRNVDVKDFFE